MRVAQGRRNDRPEAVGLSPSFRFHPSLVTASLMVAAVLLIGCRDDGEGFTSLTPEPPAIDERGVTVYFPRQAQDTDDFMNADNRGPLVLDDDGCLRMIASDGGDAHIVIWPPSGIAVAIVEGEVALISEETGELIAHVGDWIMLGGGGPFDDSLHFYMDSPPPEPCAGEGERYWISGSEQSIRRIPPES